MEYAETCLCLLSLLVIANLMEAVLPSKQVSDIGEYVFGLRKVDAEQFEASVLSGIVTLFSAANAISWWKVLAFTIAYSSAFGGWNAYHSILFYDLFGPQWVVATIGMTILIGYPADVVTLIVAKALWVRGNWFRWPWTAFGSMILALPAFAAIFIMTLAFTVLAPRMRYGLGAQVAQQSVVQVQLIIWLMPFLLTVAGSLIRLALKATKIGYWLLERTNVHRHPLSYIWLVLCFVLPVPIIFVRSRFFS